MAKQKYRSAATGGRFKQRGQGLRVAEDRIREQRKTEIDAITLAKYQHQEASGNYISGIADAQRFEMGVLEEKQKLENKVREHKYNALVKKADTDVKRLEDEAKAKKKTADWWADFAPKFAQNLGKLAKGGLEFADAYRGQKQWEALKASGILDEITDQKEAVNSKLFSNITKDGHTGDPDESNTLHDRTFKISTHWASKRLAKWYKENKQLVRSDTIAAFEASGGEYGEDNAIEVQKFNAHQLLTQLGISPTSQGGKEILEEAIKIGSEDRKTFSEVRKVGETENDIRLQITTLKSLDIKSEDFKTNFHELVNLHKNGYFKTDSGISTPYDNPRSIADGLELAYKSYIDANLDNMSDSDLLRLLSLDIPDTGTGEKSSFENKHPLRAEDIREYYLQKKTKQLDDLNNQREAKGLTRFNEIKADYDNEVWLLDDNGQRLPNLNKDKELELREAWNIKTINLIASDKNLTDKSRSLAYTLVGFDIKNHDIAVDYSLIQADLFAGNTEDAFKRYSALSSEDKNKMASLISIFKDLEDNVIISGKKGAQGLFKFNKELILSGQQIESIIKGKVLTTSGEEKLAEMNRVIFEKYEFFLNELGGPGNEQNAAQAAVDWMNKEWKDGETDKNHWLYRTGGDKGSGYEFETVKNNLKHRTEVLNKITEIKKLRAESKNGIVPVDAASLGMVMQKYPNAANLILDFEEGDTLWALLYKEEVVSTKDLEKLANQIKNAQNLNLKYREGKYLVDFDIPDNIHEWYKHYKDDKGNKPTLNYVINKVLEQRHEKFGDEFPLVQISADDKDLIQLIKNDKRGYNPINAYGIEKYQDGIAITGKIPQKKYIRQYIEGELDIMQLFAEHTGIGLTQNIDSNGVMTYTFSGKNDSKNYLENGGLDMPSNMTPVELMYAMGFPELVSERAQQMKKGNRGFLGWRSLVDYATADLFAGTIATDLDKMGP